MKKSTALNIVISALLCAPIAVGCGDSEDGDAAGDGDTAGDGDAGGDGDGDTAGDGDGNIAGDGDGDAGLGGSANKGDGDGDTTNSTDGFAGSCVSRDFTCVNYINEYDTPESTKTDCDRIEGTYDANPCPTENVTGLCDQPPWKENYYYEGYGEFGLEEFSCDQIGGTWTEY